MAKTCDNVSTKHIRQPSSAFMGMNLRKVSFQRQSETDFAQRHKGDNGRNDIRVSLVSSADVVRSGFAQFTHLPFCEVRIGSSSIMNCVLPMAPIMCVPVALCHFFDILSPVWQPQLLA